MSMFVILSIVIPVVVIAITIIAMRSAGMFGMSKKKQQQAMQLMQTGTKARAWIMTIQPTGTVVNYINIQCDIGFRLEPIHGGPTHDVTKRVLLSQTNMPRIGEVWPAWFDPTNPSLFAVGQPTGYTPEQAALFQEFGIPSPFGPR